MFALLLKHSYVLVGLLSHIQFSLSHTHVLIETLTLVDYEVLHALLGAAGAPQSLNRPFKNLFLL